MQTVLEQGSIDKPLTFDVGLIQLSFIPVCSLKKYMQHFSQIVPRVYTSVLFIFIMAGLNACGLQSKLLITPLSD